MQIRNLKCEYKVNPVGIDVVQPRLSWNLINDDGCRQHSYRVLVASTQENIEKDLGDLWDSGIVETTELWGIYQGVDLPTEAKVFWCVETTCIINGKEQIIKSMPTCFITGLLGQKWDSEWIRFFWNPTVPILKKTINVSKKVKQAVIYGSALGIYDLDFNDNRVGDNYFAPGWTDYRKRVYYNAFEITDRIKNGFNTIKAKVAPGWYAGFLGPFEDKGYYGKEPFFSCRLRIDYTDGTHEIVRTDKSWEGCISQITRSDLLMGEEYDASIEIDGKDILAGASGNVINPEKHNCIPEIIQNYPGSPVKKVMELKALSVTEPCKGTFTFDLGQNMVGVARFKFNNLKAGQKLKIIYGEMLNEDGTVYTANLRSAKATDRYTAKGGNEEIWTPEFTFHGFRYVEIDGLTGMPDTDTVTGIVYSSMHELNGTFECGVPDVNKLYSNIIWGLRGNYFDIPTDCPQRDERLGWSGDTQMFIKSASYVTDIGAFFRKWLVDLNDAQREDGAYTDVAPSLGRLGDGAAAWGDAGIICPYVLWQAYGDTEFIRPFWNEMKKYMEYICADNNRHNGKNAVAYGDWLSVNSNTPVELIGLAYRAYDSRLMVEMAEAIGISEDAEFYKKEAEASKDAFKKYFFIDKSRLAYPTQTACALAIYMDLVDGEDLELTAKTFVSALEKHKGYLSTGFVGTGYLCPALSKIGRDDLAVQLLLNDGYPSWLYEVKNGATTIWERWNSWTKKDGFGDVSMNSFNHYAFGAVCEWMFAELGGITHLEPGYSKILIAPKPDRRLGFVKTSYKADIGVIKSEWKYDGDSIEFNITIPTGATAEIKLPGEETKIVGSGSYQYIVEN